MMKSTEYYTESFKSRVDDIRKDGPSIYTSILELIDNSLGWGKANNISVDYDPDRMELIIKDNGENGFGTIDSLHRFFSLGMINKDITELTIGKYGKGGYKSTINIGNDVSITTYFDGKGYIIGTDFITMMKENTQSPTILLSEIDNSENKNGTEFKLKIRPEYKLTYHTESLKRNIIRAYHISNIDISIDKEIVDKTCPFGNEYLYQGEFDIVYDRGKKLFLSFKTKGDILYEDEGEDDETDKKERVYVGKFTMYVLKDTLKKYSNLGDNPGMDVYRNNRMCNTNYPICHLGLIGDNLSSGMMRGKRCHMTFEYTNIKLCDNLDMDDCVGLTTNKEISEESSKWNTSLLKILEKKALLCSKKYEDITNQRKDDHLNLIEKDLGYVLGINRDRSASKFNEEMKKMNGKKIKEMKERYEIFVENKAWKFDDEIMGYSYPSFTNSPTKEEKGKYNWVRGNSKLISTSGSVIKVCNQLLEKKNLYREKQNILEILQKEHDIDENKSEILLNYCKKLRDEDKMLKKYQSEELYVNCIKSYEILIDITKHIKEEIKLIEKYEKDKEIYEKELINTKQLYEGQKKAKAEEEKVKAEEEKVKAEEKKVKAEEEKVKAEEEKVKAEEEKAEEEKVKAEEKKVKAEEEKVKAEEEQDRKEIKKKRGRKPRGLLIPNYPDTIQNRNEWIKWLNDTLTDEEKIKIYVTII